MTEFYYFAGNHPWLTFFLAYLVVHLIVGVAWAFRGGRRHCTGCQCGHKWTLTM